MKNLDLDKVLSSAVVAILLSAVFCFAAGKSVKTIDSYWYDENKTVLEINNFDDFVEFQRLLYEERITFENKEVHLKTDIIVFDTTDSDIWSQKIKPKDFKEKKYLLRPRPFIKKYFRGKFDGNGHYIRGLYRMSLSQYIKNAEIKNLNISHSYFDFSAGIAYISKNSIIRNCNVSGNGTFSGLCTFASGTTIKNCSFNGNIKGKQNYVGAITGYAGKSTILDSNNVQGTIIGVARRTDPIAGYISLSSVAINNKFSGNIVEKIGFVLGEDIGYSFGLGNDYGISTGDINIFLGAAINRHFSLSLGAGYHFSTVKKTNGIKYTSGDEEDDVLEKVIKNEKRLPKDDILYNSSFGFVPIFLKPRFYLSEKTAMSPFIDADIGIMLCRAIYRYQEEYTYWYGDYWYGNYRTGYKYYSDDEFYTSFYFNPSIGVKTNLFSVSLGYKMWIAEYEKLLPGKDGWNLDNLINTEKGSIIKKPNGAISLRIGISL
ncbi:MAG: right-handed parallel beta-helix repeat-containing protein [Chitinivibrionia bacterium]|nr:right-handed parallel beta-helix repeat-containing protein [Chitinivibrionia bacterium]